MTDYLNLAKELSRKHIEARGWHSHQTLADILQEVIEAERAEAKKKIVLLRKLLVRYRNETPACNQPHMICHEADEALAATADLSGLVLCEAEPVAWMFIDDEECGYYQFNRNPPTKEQVEYLAQENRPAWNPLYKERRKK